MKDKTAKGARLYGQPTIEVISIELESVIASSNEGLTPQDPWDPWGQETTMLIYDDSN